MQNSLYNINISVLKSNMPHLLEVVMPCTELLCRLSQLIILYSRLLFEHIPDLLHMDACLHHIFCMQTFLCCINISVLISNIPHLLEVVMPCFERLCRLSQLILLYSRLHTFEE